MPNAHVHQRLAGIQQILRGVHQAGGAMSAATRGREWEGFVDHFLAEVLPRPYRFGNRDVTDMHGSHSGQLDVVVEYPFAPTLPLGIGSPRLYLAEGVAAVVEVKSDVAHQWNEAVGTARQHATLTRHILVSSVMLHAPGPKIPLYVAGYTGWKTIETARRHLETTDSIAGILVIDPGVFVCRKEYDIPDAKGPWALWGLVSSLYRLVCSLESAYNDPVHYAV
jgi:hypothetical protein